MIPKVMIIDNEKGPDKGIDIYGNYLLVKEENYQSAFDALTLLTGIEFLVFTREEYLEWLREGGAI